MYSQITDGVEVTVSTEYDPEQSSLPANYYVWSYTVTIENFTQQTIQLLNRYWKIVDDKGRVEEVEGAGVVGRQPILQPGEKFQYTSHTHLNSPSGMMFGLYEMLDDNEELFTVEIPAFSLDTPSLKRAIH